MVLAGGWHFESTPQAYPPQQSSVEAQEAPKPPQTQFLYVGSQVRCVQQSGVVLQACEAVLQVPSWHTPPRQWYPAQQSLSPLATLQVPPEVRQLVVQVPAGQPRPLQH